MRGKIFYIISLIFILSSFLKAQNKFEYDYARFFSPFDSTSYLEVYYSFFTPALKTVSDNNTELKEGILGIKILDTEKSEIVVDRDWELSLTPSVTKNNDNLMVGILDFPLESSAYNVEITASDKNNEAFNEVFNFNLTVPPLSGNILTVSDIVLASKIVPQSNNTESIFYKNSMEVVPNPSLIYGDSNPVIFFYSEIYGLESADNQYIVEQKLFNSNNELVHKKARNVSGENSSVVELGVIKANELNSGIYNLVVSIKNLSNNLTASSSKRVYIYNKDRVNQSTSFEQTVSSQVNSELMIMSEDELNDSWQKAKYIATESEISNWQKLTSVDGKRNFLSRFWGKRDSEKDTESNEYKRDYFDRVRYANKNFRNISSGEGWKTSRGRVYIKYGVPDEIERFQNERYSEPYEIWHYRNIEGGVIFLFADEEGLNIYRLVHSTKKGEIYNRRAYLKYVQ